MSAYVILLTVFFGSYFYFGMRCDQRTTTKYMITTFFVGYIFLLCFRDSSVGTDVDSYIRTYFYSLKNISWKDVIVLNTDELGFSITSKLITDWFDNPQYFIAIFAILSVTPVMILYRNESREAAVCCSFFMISLLFEIFFSGLRQSVALGLTVPAYYYAKQKRIIPFLLIVLLATSFHASAIMILFIFPIYHAKVTGKWIWFVIPAMVIVYHNNELIFTLLFEIFGGKYFEKYSALLGETNQYGLLMLFVLLCVYCLLVMDEKQLSDDDIGLRNILLLATVIQFFAPLHSIVSRMNYYFILFIPIVVTRANEKSRCLFAQLTRVASWIMTIYFIFYFFFSKGDPLRIMEYTLCF